MEFFTRVLSGSNRTRERIREAQKINVMFANSLKDDLIEFLDSEENTNLINLLNTVYDTSFPEEQVFLKAPTQGRLQSKKDLIVRLLMGLDALGVSEMTDILFYIKNFGMEGIERTLTTLLELFAPVLAEKQAPEFTTDDVLDAMDYEWHSTPGIGSPLLNVIASATSSPRASGASANDLLHPLTPLTSPFRRVLSDRTMRQSQAFEHGAKAALDKSSLAKHSAPTALKATVSDQYPESSQAFQADSLDQVNAAPVTLPSIEEISKSSNGEDGSPQPGLQKQHRRKSSSLRQLFDDEAVQELIEKSVREPLEQISRNSSLQQSSSNVAEIIHNHSGPSSPCSVRGVDSVGSDSNGHLSNFQARSSTKISTQASLPPNSFPVSKKGWRSSSLDLSKNNKLRQNSDDFAEIRKVRRKMEGKDIVHDPGEGKIAPSEKHAVSGAGDTSLDSAESPLANSTATDDGSMTCTIEPTPSSSACSLKPEEIREYESIGEAEQNRECAVLEGAENKQSSTDLLENPLRQLSSASTLSLDGIASISVCDSVNNADVDMCVEREGMGSFAANGKVAIKEEISLLSHENAVDGSDKNFDVATTTLDVTTDAENKQPCTDVLETHLHQLSPATTFSPDESVQRSVDRANSAGVDLCVEREGMGSFAGNGKLAIKEEISLLLHENAVDGCENNVDVATATLDVTTDAENKQPCTDMLETHLQQLSPASPDESVQRSVYDRANSAGVDLVEREGMGSFAANGNLAIKEEISLLLHENAVDGSENNVDVANTILDVTSDAENELSSTDVLESPCQQLSLASTFSPDENVQKSVHDRDNSADVDLGVAREGMESFGARAEVAIKDEISLLSHKNAVDGSNNNVDVATTLDVTNDASDAYGNNLAPDKARDEDAAADSQGGISASLRNVVHEKSDTLNPISLKGVFPLQLSLQASADHSNDEVMHETDRHVSKISLDQPLHVGYEQGLEKVTYKSDPINSTVKRSSSQGDKLDEKILPESQDCGLAMKGVSPGSMDVTFQETEPCMQMDNRDLEEAGVTKQIQQTLSTSQTDLQTSLVVSSSILHSEGTDSDNLQSGEQKPNPEIHNDGSDKEDNVASAFPSHQNFNSKADERRLDAEKGATPTNSHWQDLKETGTQYDDVCCPGKEILAPNSSNVSNVTDDIADDDDREMMLKSTGLGNIGHAMDESLMLQSPKHEETSDMSETFAGVGLHLHDIDTESVNGTVASAIVADEAGHSRKPQFHMADLNEPDEMRVLSSQSSSDVGAVYSLSSSDEEGIVVNNHLGDQKADPKVGLQNQKVETSFSSVDEEVFSRAGSMGPLDPNDTYVSLKMIPKLDDLDINSEPNCEKVDDEDRKQTADLTTLPTIPIAQKKERGFDENTSGRSPDNESASSAEQDYEAESENHSGKVEGIAPTMTIKDQDETCQMHIGDDVEDSSVLSSPAFPNEQLASRTPELGLHLDLNSTHSELLVSETAEDIKTNEYKATLCTLPAVNSEHSLQNLRKEGYGETESSNVDEKAIMGLVTDSKPSDVADDTNRVTYEVEEARTSGEVLPLGMKTAEDQNQVPSDDSDSEVAIGFLDDSGALHEVKVASRDDHDPLNELDPHLGDHDSTTKPAMDSVCEREEMTRDVEDCKVATTAQDLDNSLRNESTSSPMWEASDVVAADGKHPLQKTGDGEGVNDKSEQGPRQSYAEDERPCSTRALDMGGLRSLSAGAPGMHSAKSEQQNFSQPIVAAYDPELNSWDSHPTPVQHKRRRSHLSKLAQRFRACYSTVHVKT